MHRCLGSTFAASFLATINDARKHWAAQFHHHLYPSDSNVVREDWGNTTGVQTAISIMFLPAARTLLDFPPRVLQPGDCSIYHCQNGLIND